MIPTVPGTLPHVSSQVAVTKPFDLTDMPANNLSVAFRRAQQSLRGLA